MHPLAIATAHTGEWSSATYPLPIARGNRQLRVVAVCVVCLFLGMLLGHVVREGSAYAAGRASRPREAHAAATAHASSSETASRTKDTTLGVAVAPPRGAKSSRSAARRTPARPAAAAPTATAPLDALFVDFEPTFRTGQ